MIKIPSVSFKAYIPVHFYAKNPANDRYVPVLKNKNIRKCQSYVVRNLNGTAKKNKDSGFSQFYAKYDKDYEKSPQVHSVYQKKGPLLYMVTGDDVDTVKEMAKPIGIAKSESIDALGHSKSYEARLAAKNYINDVNNFIKTSCHSVKSKENGQKLALYLFFNPVYKKKSGDLSGFTFSKAQIREQGTHVICDEYDAFDQIVLN